MNVAVTKLSEKMGEG